LPTHKQPRLRGQSHENFLPVLDAAYNTKNTGMYRDHLAKSVWRGEMEYRYQCSDKRHEVPQHPYNNGPTWSSHHKYGYTGTRTQLAYRQASPNLLGKVGPVSQATVDRGYQVSICILQKLQRFLHLPVPVPTRRIIFRGHRLLRVESSNTGF
jgi:hypothetical protein